MTVKVKSPFFDNKGLHNVGELVEVDNFNEAIMEKVEEEPKKKKAKKEAL